MRVPAFFGCAECAKLLLEVELREHHDAVHRVDRRRLRVVVELPRPESQVGAVEQEVVRRQPGDAAPHLRKSIARRGVTTRDKEENGRRGGRCPEPMHENIGRFRPGWSRT